MPPTVDDSVNNAVTRKRARIQEIEDTNKRAHDIIDVVLAQQNLMVETIVSLHAQMGAMLDGHQKFMREGMAALDAFASTRVQPLTMPAPPVMAPVAPSAPALGSVRARHALILLKRFLPGFLYLDRLDHPIAEFSYDELMTYVNHFAENNGFPPFKSKVALGRAMRECDLIGTGILKVHRHNGIYFRAFDREVVAAKLAMINDGVPN